MEKKIKILGIIMLLIGVPTYFVVSLKKMDSNTKQEIQDYPLLNYSQEFSGIISKLHTKQGSPYIVLNNYTKFSMHPTRNYAYQPPYLFKFIEIGDSINKKKNSDTLFIFKGKDEFYFIHGKK